MNTLWCEEHDHFKRTCPWCESNENLRNLREDRDDLIALLKHICDEVDEHCPEEFSVSIRRRVDEVLKEIERDDNE